MPTPKLPGGFLALEDRHLSRELPKLDIVTIDQRTDLLDRRRIIVGLDYFHPQDRSGRAEKVGAIVRVGDRRPGDLNHSLM